MDASSPFFSVIVPSYNQAQYVGAALDSLLAQSDSEWEAVVVNDGSTDSTAHVLEEYQLKDGRIRVIHKENGGVGSALNEGLRHARGEWICWLSSDDLFNLRKLEIHRREITRHPNCRFFFTLAREFDDVTGRWSQPPMVLANAHRDWQLLMMMAINWIFGNSICINRRSWVRIGLFDESLRYAQDYDMWLRLMARYAAVLIPEPTSFTRRHAQQGTSQFPEAGAYDSAKAAIRFLNAHAFADLVPWVDLDDAQMARKAVARALYIAAKPAAQLYALGPHSALLDRITEWAWDPSARSSRCVERQMVRSWSREVSRYYDGTLFGALWARVADEAERKRPCFEYHAVSPAAIAEAHYWMLCSRNNCAAVPLRRYLQRFEHRLLSESPNVAQAPSGASAALVAPIGKPHWVSASAVVAVARCPSLLREQLWWMQVARSSIPGQLALQLAWFVVMMMRKLRYPLRQGVDSMPRHRATWPDTEARER